MNKIIRNILGSLGLVVIIKILYWLYLEGESLGVDPWARDNDKINKYKLF